MFPKRPLTADAECLELQLTVVSLFTTHQQIVNLVSGFYWFFGVFGFRETWKPETEKSI
jgi:hypothetical protein